MPTFEFYRLRFHFQAIDPVRFPVSGANMLRGACGLFLKNVAPPEVYTALFEPGRDLAPAPSGLANWPRPFVFRAWPLNGLNLPASRAFAFDLHLFELRRPVHRYFQDAFAAWAAAGIGPRRSRARLDRVESLDLDGRPNSGAPCSISLDREAGPVSQMTVRFVTPTELKAGGEVLERPEFPVLFARIRDRLATLRALFGPGPLELDFRGMGEHACQVALVRCDLVWQNATRTSGRTGQTHSLGGFTGEADYSGALEEFVPWVRAARWTGVGRQTVWGKGEIHILSK